MVVYRLTKSKYASDISGLGASLYPGRWNKKGTSVLYTGINKEIALLENIVNLPPMISPELDLLTIEIPDNSVLELNITDLPRNWSQFPAPTILAEIGQEWVDENSFLALKVPSSIIHTPSNIILNCRHLRYTEVTILEQKKFKFDSRLKK